jgi:hypothetical protein
VPKNGALLLYRRRLSEDSFVNWMVIGYRSG